MEELLSSISPASTGILTVAILVLVVIVRTLSRRRQKAYNTSSSSSSTTTIPWAPNSIPILGHALQYRKDPGQFLLEACEQVGELFRVNMAGKIMVIACGPRFQRIIASAPESKMSARQAVADIGFEHMLGYLNVYKGTDLHKGIIKAFWYNNNNQPEQLTSWIESIQDSLQQEVSSREGQQVEFMNLIRRVTLRVSVERFIGSFFLEGWEDGFDFIEVFMKFQDDLEDVTAKSVVIPRFLAFPLLLWPLKQRRLQLQNKISQRLQDAFKDMTPEKYGFWLVKLKDNYHPDEISEFIVGLLFAAHKNPAIGIAQSYLMLCEHATKEQKQLLIQESKTLLSNPSLQESDFPTLHRLCLETLRLTAHSIGAIRTAKEDFFINTEYVIPKGATVALAHLCSSLNPKFWNDPHRVNLNSTSLHRPKESYENDYLFTVFSQGVHKCPGQKVALFMLRCTVAVLLVDYKISMLHPIPPLCFERGTLGQRTGPVLVTVTKK